MRTLAGCLAVLVSNSAFAAGPATGVATQPTSALAPIADTPPPPPRTDLGAVVEPTVSLRADAPYLEGRGSIRWLADADTGAWSTNASRGAMYSGRKKAASGPDPAAMPIDPNLPAALAEKVRTALINEKDPAKLEALAASLDQQTCPIAIDSLRQRAAALRGLWGFSVKSFFVDLPASSRTRVATCHFTNTSVSADLLIQGASSQRVPARTAMWIDGASEASGAVFTLVGNQEWQVDQCNLTGYAGRPGSAATRMVLAGPAASPAIAMQPLASASAPTDVVVSVQHPVVSNRASMSASWSGSPAVQVDATSNALSATGLSQSASFSLTIDVYREAQRAEIVACEVQNLRDAPVVFAGQPIAPHSSRSLEVTLAPVGSPVWQSAHFAGSALTGSLTIRECHVRPAPPSSRMERRSTVRP